ncbi:hypothetical protein JXJ21_09985 [candidate division KSB1 bacterium]|nr:hypothetical protein [candidate division KSB1 bacterium]
MGHNISGLIAEIEVLSEYAVSKELHSPIKLKEKLGFLPLSDNHLDFLFSEQHNLDQGLIYLSEELKQEIAGISVRCAVIYIETDYWGGTGTQGATIYKDRKCIFGPKVGEIGPISEALRIIGFQSKSKDQDEFEAFGLNKFRDNDDWIEAYKKKRD